MIIVDLVIKFETQGQHELYVIAYKIGFFLTHDVFLLILGALLVIPLLLLIYSIFIKRKDLIKGFSFSTIISVTLLILALNS
tara:strand:- start:956 stop:1201 length:246 start_codon:yes stop_codon:yes gene_type:complete